MKKLSHIQKNVLQFSLLRQCMKPRVFLGASHSLHLSSTRHVHDQLHHFTSATPNLKTKIPSNFTSGTGTEPVPPSLEYFTDSTKSRLDLLASMLHTIVLVMLSYSCYQSYKFEEKNTERENLEKKSFGLVKELLKAGVSRTLKPDPSNEDYKKALEFFLKAIKTLDDAKLTASSELYNEVLLKAAQTFERMGYLEEASQIYLELSEYYYSLVEKRRPVDLYDRPFLLRSALMTATKYVTLNPVSSADTSNFLSRRLHQSTKEVLEKLGVDAIFPSEKDYDKAEVPFDLNTFRTKTGQLLDEYLVKEVLTKVPMLIIRERDISGYYSTIWYAWTPFQHQFIATKDLHAFLNVKRVSYRQTLGSVSSGTVWAFCNGVNCQTALRQFNNFMGLIVGSNSRLDLSDSFWILNNSLLLNCNNIVANLKSNDLPIPEDICYESCLGSYWRAIFHGLEGNFDESQKEFENTKTLAKRYKFNDILKMVEAESKKFREIQRDTDANEQLIFAKNSFFSSMLSKVPQNPIIY